MTVAEYAAIDGRGRKTLFGAIGWGEMRYEVSAFLVKVCRLWDNSGSTRPRLIIFFCI